MIFLTVGTQLGFDRLIKEVDDWSLDNQNVKIFAQIGKSNYHPKNFSYTDFLKPGEYNSVFSSSNYVVSHAGMGTIISCLLYHIPVVVMPRKASLSEHRNDHQISTCNRFLGKNGCYVAWDEHELRDFLNNLTKLKASVGNSNESLKFSESLYQEVASRFGYW